MSDPAVIAQKALQENFPLFGGARTLSLYQVMNETTYNTSTRNAVATVAAEFNLYIIFYGFNMTRNNSQERWVDGETIRARDKIALFPALDLPATPKINDRINDGITLLRVVGVNPDPLKASYELHVRPIDDL